MTRVEALAALGGQVGVDTRRYQDQVLYIAWVRRSDSTWRGEPQTTQRAALQWLTDFLRSDDDGV